MRILVVDDEKILRELTSALCITFFASALCMAQVSSEQQSLLERIAQSTGINPSVHWDAMHHTPRFIEGKLTQSSNDNKIKIARNFLRNYQNLFRIVDAENEFSISKEFADEMGKTHIRFQQQYQGVPVWGSEIIVHLDPDGSIYCVGGRTIPTPEVSVHPTIDSRTAVTMVMALFPADYSLLSIGRCVYTRNTAPKLAWKAEVVGGPDKAYLVFLDAITGELLLRFNQTPFDGPVVGSGVGVDGQARPLQAYQSSTYRLIDVTRTMFGPGGVAGNETYGNIITKHSPTGSVISSTSLVFDDPPAVDAHYYAGEFYEYLSTTSGRMSWDGYGRSIVSNVHYGTDYNNAFWSWSTNRLYYGDGDGMNFRPWAGSRDIVAHEITHGITGVTSGLIYLDQSGSLSESFSDIMAAAFDTRNWTIGEDITLAPPAYLRNLVNPHLGYQSFPLPFGAQTAHISEYLYAPFDNGGVHFNSGIHNKVMYNLSQSTSRADAARIFYRTFTMYLTSDAQFVDARNASVRSARDLNLDTTAVKVAYEQVGIFPVTQDASEFLKYDPLLEENVGANFGLLPTIATSSPNHEFSLLMTPSYIPAHVMTIAFIYGSGMQGRTVLVSLHADSSGLPGRTLGNMSYTILTSFAFAALLDVSSLGITITGNFHVVLSSPSAADFSVIYFDGYSNNRSLYFNGSAWSVLNGALGIRASVRYQRNTTTGVRWARQTTNTPQSLRSLAMLSLNDGWAVGTAGTILRTTTGGLVWNSVSNPSGGNLNSIFFTDPQHGWIVGDITDIMYTTNGGTTWQTVANPTVNNLKSVYFVNSNIGWAVGNFGTVLKTTDGGLNWVQQSSQTASNFFGVHFFNELTGWAVGANSSIYRTTDGGANWGMQTSPVAATFYSLDFVDQQRGWIAGSNGTILKTTDGGSNWIMQASPTNNALRSVRALDASTVYAVGFFGTLVKTTDGVTWQTESIGLSTNCWDVQFVDQNNGWIAGEDGFIFNARPVTTAAGVVEELPERYHLSQNYPNPFNPSTTIRFLIPTSAYVSLKVFNLLGQEVATLMNEVMKPGSYEVTFDGTNLPSGVYFYPLQVYPDAVPTRGDAVGAGSFTVTKKLVLLR